jgi:hypothetical protein
MENKGENGTLRVRLVCVALLCPHQGILLRHSGQGENDAARGFHTALTAMERRGWYGMVQGRPQSVWSSSFLSEAKIRSVRCDLRSGLFAT